jgi:hypothetical protein
LRTSLTLPLLVIALPLAAAPVPKALKKPPANPDGAWRLVEFHSDGQVVAVGQMTRDWVISGEYVFAGRLVEPAHGQKGQANFTISDPDRPHLRKWGDNPAAFELDRGGDTLRVSYAHDGRKEITECKPQPGVYYYVFERVK